MHADSLPCLGEYESQKGLVAQSLALGLLLPSALSFLNSQLLPPPRPTVQVFFEDMGFQSVMTTSAANLALRKQWHRTPSAPASQAGCGLVLDAGFSATHAIPVFDGNILYDGVRRLNLGGKVLTNYLKELVSYRWGRGAARQLMSWGNAAQGRGSTVDGWRCLQLSVSVCLGHPPIPLLCTPGLL